MRDICYCVHCSLDRAPFKAVMDKALFYRWRMREIEKAMYQEKQKETEK